MDIRGIQKTSLVDYPGKLSTVLFFAGCNFLCPFCQNPDLVFNKENLETISPEQAIDTIKRRLRLIDGVVLTGGEPTLFSQLDIFIKRIKDISLPVKLDTNGSNPQAISGLLKKKLVDYIAIDIKTSPERYRSASGVNFDFNIIMETIEAVKVSGIDYEIRTTCVPRFITLEDFDKIKSRIGRVKRYYLQQFINKITLDPSLGEDVPYALDELNKFKEFVSGFADICELRGI